jgi:poly-gamma-glutamate synthesis protein (capsule biosynthesis protein)
VSSAAATIVAVGDVIPTRLIGDRDPHAGLTSIATRLQRADVAFGDLEVPLTERGHPWDKIVVYRATPRLSRELAALGFDVLGLANNQTMNYGVVGLEDTIAALEDAEVAHVGAGTERRATAPVVLVRQGVRIAFLAFTCVAPAGWGASASQLGLAVLRVRTAYEVDSRWALEEPGIAPRVSTWLEGSELARASAAVAEARRQADLVLVSVHWGVGSSAEPIDYQRQLAYALVDAGADCVLGNHPPALQGFEVRGRALISWSQGTFIRQQQHVVGDPSLAPLYARMPRAGGLLSLVGSAAGLVSAVFEPLALDDDGLPRLTEGAGARQVAELVADRSHGLESVQARVAERIEMRFPSGASIGSGSSARIGS